MKKATRNLLIIATALILVGGILGFTGYGLGGMKSISLTPDGPVVIRDDGDASVLVDERWNKLTALDIDSGILDLRIVEGDSFSLKGSYDSRLMGLDISESKGVLTIRGTYHNRWWLNLGPWSLGSNLRESVGQMTLTYPRGAVFDQVSAKSDAGNLHIEGLDANSLAVAFAAGNFTGRNITAEELSVDMALGNCEIKGLEVTDAAQAEMNSGRLNLTDARIRNLTSESNLGSFDFSGSLSGEAEIRMNLGNLDLDLDVAEKDLSYSIESDMGSVELNGHSLGSDSQRTATSPTLELDIRTNMGSVDIRTR
jgi:hypothetical protein